MTFINGGLTKSAGVKMQNILVGISVSEDNSVWAKELSVCIHLFDIVNLYKTIKNIVYHVV